MPTMQLFRKAPATISLILINVIVFAFEYLIIESREGPAWTLGLLRLGAQFNPFTLDKEWYRIFTHMFMHGGILHIAMNMYGLYSVGLEIESFVGTKKFLWVYFLSGISSGLSSLYFGLFAISVGASGAIFGMFGFALIVNIFFNKKDGRPIGPILVNFLIFLGINLVIAKSVNADNAAHFGGLTTGLLLGLFSLATHASFSKLKLEYLFVPLFLIVYFLLPRYQVNYYKFFQKVVAIEREAKKEMATKPSDDEYLKKFRQTNEAWDSALMMLNREDYLPKQLSGDTFKLRHYINWRKKENDFRITMIERESYIYLDSVEVANDSIRKFIGLDYFLSYELSNASDVVPAQTPTPPNMIKVLYDKDWIETDVLPAMYYRIGSRDSLHRWEGSVRDFYIDDRVQMKGAYKNGKKDGIFIYYSDHKTYTSAGRFANDRSIGKWQIFHNNGKLEREVFYNQGYFVKNIWDSTGTQVVKDGNGRVTTYHSSGEIASTGEYRNGKQEGYWFGKYENGKMFFEENFQDGRLTRGRSRGTNGEIVNYDESSFRPLPEGGVSNYHQYLRSATHSALSDNSQGVLITFRVTKEGKLADIQIERSVSPEIDEQAKRIVMEGPKWIPAKEHGQQPVDGFAFAKVDF
jgi:membrane associated rhomboid family serine protease/antitoxin component YwqK of YwqJK toxin-antitoxin module